MDFGWDEAKNKANLLKHGIAFEDVTGLFGGDEPLLIDHDDPSRHVRQTAMNKQSTSTPSKTDWERLDRMTDDDIDYTGIPPLGDEFFARAHVYIPPAKRASYIELDEDVMTWFRERDKHYPNFINIVLRKYIEIQQEIAG